MAKKINIANIAAGLDSVQAVIDNLHMVGRQESVPAACIRMNPRNSARAKDTDEEIEELAAGIQTSGLIHPLAVNKVSDTEYRLMSGERRYRAITTYLHWDTIPCMVYEGLSPDEELCVLITANMQTRRYTPEDRLMLYEQLDTALRHMRDAGEYKGGLQKGIADLMGVSERQIRTYKAALENVRRQEEPADPAAESPAPEKTRGISLAETARKRPKENPLDIPVWKKRAEEALLNHYSQEELKRIFCIQLLPPREAAKALKPSGGYAGGTVIYPDKTGGGCTTDTKGITIQYGRKPSPLPIRKRKRCCGGQWLKKRKSLPLWATKEHTREKKHRSRCLCPNPKIISRQNFTSTGLNTTLTCCCSSIRPIRQNAKRYPRRRRQSLSLKKQ